MSEQWTPQKARRYANELNATAGSMPNHNDSWMRNAVQATQHLHKALDALDAQQAELAAARERIENVMTLAYTHRKNCQNYWPDPDEDEEDRASMDAVEKFVDALRQGSGEGAGK